LYFAILAKRAALRDGLDRRVVVFERNQADDTFGFGVVFSDATLDGFALADPESHAELGRALARWEDIEVFVGEEVLRSTGHGFAGMERRRLLSILQARAVALGVDLRFGVEADLGELSRGFDLVVAADGVNSIARTRLAAELEPSIDLRPNRFVWLGSTQPLSSFTFYFERAEAGLFRVHAYRYDETRSTFIIECTEETFARTGLRAEDEAGAVRYCERLFARRLDGHALLTNRSVWRRFPTVRNRRWHARNMVLLGDAAHTAHFSIGSGTKLAMEDAVALAAALDAESDLPTALAAYERARRPAVESVQRAADTSLRWFEETERYFDKLDPLTFAYSLLTRSLRINHENLRLRDPALVERVEQRFAGPPMFAPLSLRGLTIPNRIGVSAMCQYRAVDGVVGDWHLVHYGGRAIGGAGLMMTEMTCVSADARISPGCAGLWNEAQVAAWRRVVTFARTHGSAKLGLQLGHAGRKGSTRLMWEGADRPLSSGNWPIVSASPIPYFPESQVPAELDRAGMDRVIADFCRSTRFGIELGFDLLELHMAHGYLLASFLSPLTNQRRDAYGGALTRRIAFPLELLDAVRAIWPAERPLSVRISATDWHDAGLPIEEAVELARALYAHGCDIVDVSSGQTDPGSPARVGRLYQTPYAERIRLDTGGPVMTVGAISTAGDIDAILAAGRADLCLVGRAHLADPHFANRIAAQRGLGARWPPSYAALQGYRPR
jgi:anthraniloyl-CoA monooxygenase